MYGSSMYGSSMYGGMGSSLYGGSSMYGGGYGGYGSSMYGGYGGSSGMYGRQALQGQSDWFAPKVQGGAEEQKEIAKPIHELREINTTFLESMHMYGDNLYNFARRLMKGLAKLHVAVLAGSLHPSIARRLALVAIAAFAAVVAAGLRGRRRVALRTPHRGVFEGPLPLAYPLALGRASAL